MISIAILDDEYKEIINVKKIIDECSKINDISITTQDFTSGDNFLHNFSPNKFDLIFLDIDMPGRNGVEIAKKIREKDNNVLLIFITNMTGYAISGYEVEAIDFLIKPVKEDQLLEKLGKITKIIEIKREKNIMS